VRGEGKRSQQWTNERPAQKPLDQGVVGDCAEDE
jgi:hypothetical protein